MTSSPSTKRQRTAPSPPYELLYWPSIPGRAEHIRLCFEATSTPYTDLTNASPEANMPLLLSQISDQNTGDAKNPPPLAPPILRHGEVVTSQTPNILMYLGGKLGLVGGEEDENAIYRINQLALTALDGLSNEVHDTHHPVANGAYYEDQKEEAERKSADFVKNRLPKFLGYFERVLSGEASRGGEWLYGGSMTYADLVFWQCLDGTAFAFPKAVGGLREGGGYRRVFEHQERVRGLDSVRGYLESERRLGYGMGIYRYYPELDLDVE